MSSSSATNVHETAASATTRSGLRQSNATTATTTTTTATAPKRSSRKRDRTDDGGDAPNTTSKIKTSSATKTSTTKVRRPRKAKEGAVAKKKTSDSVQARHEQEQDQEQEKQRPRQPQQTQRPQPPQQTPSSRKTAISHLVDSDVPSGPEASTPPRHHRAHHHHEDEYKAGSGSADAPQSHRGYDGPPQYQSPSRHDPYQAQYAHRTSSQPAAGTTVASPPPPPPPPPRTSGTKYDPIRSVSVEGNAPREQARSVSQNLSPVKTSKASASPSISSLIDPPSTTTTAPPMTTATRVSVAPGGSDPARPSLPTRFAAVSSDAPDALPKAEHRDRRGPSRPAADEHDDAAGPASAPPATASSKAPKKESADTSAGGSTRNSSPKPGRQKEAPAPGPTGSGLLSSALFGGPASTAGQGSADNRPPTIVIELALRTEKDRYINFARLAEERYGFNAIHPSLAAQRDRLARAAGAAVERASGLASADEMSLDVSEPESNGGGGGGGGGGRGTEGSGDNGDQKPKRKRKTKGDEYNKDDPFIDDSEMVWQEQAAASKDGFFVYEGPLIKPGERPNVERYDTTGLLLSFPLPFSPSLPILRSCASPAAVSGQHR